MAMAGVGSSPDNIFRYRSIAAIESTIGQRRRRNDSDPRDESANAG